MRRLVELPNEVLDVVVGHVYAPSDLLALAVTCRSLHDVVVPDHLQWRSISIMFEDVPYLRSLLDNPRRTSLLQRLKMQSYADETGPTPGFRTIAPMTRKDPKVEELVEGLEMLASALSGIHTVEINVDCLDFALFNGFFPTLRATSPFFTNLSVAAALVVGDAHEKQLDQATAVISSISGLTHFFWDSDDYFDNPIITAVEAQIMRHCPRLQHLSLHFGYDPRILDNFPPAAISRLWEGHWPDLKWLEVDRISTSEYTGTFLDEHVGIETLSVHRNAYPWEGVAFDLPPTCLPNLRQVCWPFRQDTNTLLELLRPLPNGRLRPIEILLQVTITTYDNIDPTVNTHQSDGFLSDLEFEELCARIGEMSTLRVLGLENQRASGIHKIAQLAHMATTVEDLILWLRGWPYAETMGALAIAVGNFANLKSLHLEAIEPDIEQQWIEAAKLFGSTCKSLQHFSGFDRTDDGWVRTAKPKQEWPLRLPN